MHGARLCTAAGTQGSGKGHCAQERPPFPPPRRGRVPGAGHSHLRQLHNALLRYSCLAACNSANCQLSLGRCANAHVLCTRGFTLKNSVPGGAGRPVPVSGYSYCQCMPVALPLLVLEHSRTGTMILGLPPLSLVPSKESRPPTCVRLACNYHAAPHQYQNLILFLPVFVSSRCRPALARPSAEDRPQRQCTRLTTKRLLARL